MRKLVGIYGASGFGREVLPFVRQLSEDMRIVFIDDSAVGSDINGAQVLSWDEFTLSDEPTKTVAIAIANSAVRERLVGRCRESGIAPLEIQAPGATIMDEVEIGEHAILCPHVTITSNVRIGAGFHANIYSYVAHDCLIGDYVTFAPRVSCNGNVHIGDHAYIGTGAVIRQGTPERPLRSGRGAIVGMGAVVTKDVADGMTVVGNPARPLTKD